MEKQLHLYYIDLKYNRDLAKVDENVTSISPQIHKEDKPFLGIIVLVSGREYCVPLSSKKDKFSNLSPKNFDYLLITERHGGKDRVIAILNFNNMIPVHPTVVKRIDLKIKPNDTDKVKSYKHLLGSELSWCRSHTDLIQKRAQKTYDMIVSGKAHVKLKNRCCDFKKLEQVLDKRIKRNQDNL